MISLFRRRDTRIPIDWPVHAAAPDGVSVEFSGYDVSPHGIRLRGRDNEQFRRVMAEDGRARFGLHIPGQPEPVWVRASLCWGLGPAGRYITGWQFHRPPWRLRRALTKLEKSSIPPNEPE